MSDSKKRIREKMSGARNMLTGEMVRQKSGLIYENLRKSGILEDISLLLTYAPIRNEPDMFFLHDKIKKDYPRIATAYPKVADDKKNMDFYIVKDYEKGLACGYMNIMEPVCGKGNKVDILSFREERAVIIVPGLAFDIFGNRTGYGGGFYDRYLESACGDGGRLIKAAVCYGFQLQSEVICHSGHDIKMDYIFTDKEALRII